MVFPELRSTENYAMKNPAITSDLSQLSLCFFVKLVQDQGDQIVVSYACEHGNDMIVEIYPTRTDFFVGNKLFRFNSTNLYDDTWQHVCLTWENTQGATKLYKDGQFTEQVTNHATKNYALKAGGFLVLGQEQDSIGGGFDREQTFYGRLASVNMWDKVLSESDIAAQYTNCSVPHGSVFNWSVFKSLTHGNVTVEEPFTSTNLYDDTWQHVCLTWENIQGVAKLYKDGQFAGQVTNNATENFTLTAGGFLVLGQDQDSIGGGFIRKQTLRGRLASVNMWDKVLSESDIAAQYTNCSVPYGSVLNWSVFKNLTHGNVTVEEP
ncbi:hypothetical protein pdam_00021625, partial [Pocillopora damicornis]